MLVCKYNIKGGVLLPSCLDCSLSVASLFATGRQVLQLVVVRDRDRLMVVAEEHS